MKKPLDESEREESKSWLKAQHSENEDVPLLNDTCTGFSNKHFLIPDKIKVSHIILDHFIATLTAGHISHHMTKILISAKTQEHYLRMSHHFQ